MWMKQFTYVKGNYRATIVARTVAGRRVRGWDWQVREIIMQRGRSGYAKCVKEAKKAVKRWKDRNKWQRRRKTG